MLEREEGRIISIASDAGKVGSSGEVVYTSRVRVRRERGPERTAELPTGVTAAFGVHSDIAEHYGYSEDDYPPTPATLDYVVAAACG
jgi:hypothetical protein